MTESEALVTAVDGGVAMIEIDEAAASCGNCADKGACGKAAAGPRRYALANTVGARPGERVLVCVREGAVLKAAALSYLMPLVFVLGGGAAGAAWGGDGLPAVAGAALGLATGLAVLRRASVRLAQAREPWLAMTLKRRVIHIDKETRIC